MMDIKPNLFVRYLANNVVFMIPNEIFECDDGSTAMKFNVISEVRWK